MTIHRLLGFTGQEKEEETEREVTGKLIIVDEMSMVDTWLAHQLLKALHEEVQVVFVGRSGSASSSRTWTGVKGFIGLASNSNC